MNKKILIPVILVLCITCIHALAGGAAAPKDRSIQALWRDYEKARDGDKVKDELELLSLIKKAAFRSKAAWDYYKACTLYRDAARSRNWKLRDSLNKATDKEIERFASPLLDYFYRKPVNDSLADEILGAKEKLISGRNPDFYYGDFSLSGFSFAPVLKEDIRNDFQYVLWSMLACGNDGISDILSNELSGQYPSEQLLELSVILRQRQGVELKKCLMDFAEVHKDKAVSLLALDRLNSIRFNEMQEYGSTSEDFISFRSSCGDFESKRDSFSPFEKDIVSCCSLTEGIIRTLDDKQVSGTIEDGILIVVFKNLKSASYSIRRGKEEIFNGTVINDANSFFLRDSVEVALPSLDDGLYTIELTADGTLTLPVEYEKYTVSVALNGTRVFAAEAFSGKPLKKICVDVLDSSDKVLGTREDLELDGFTGLGEEISSLLKPGATWIRCYYTDTEGIRHESRNVPYSEGRDQWEPDNRLMAEILTDKGAYNSGETLHYKAIAYSGLRDKSLRAIEEGTAITVSLSDPTGKQLCSESSGANEFGSVSGAFTLPEGKVNGIFSITASIDGEEVNSHYIRVDDFVLPSFELEFEEDGKLYLPGDSIIVKGTVKSYAGHSVNSARISYSVQGGGSKRFSGILSTDQAGCFSLAFPTDIKDGRYQSFDINVTVTDNSSETLQWNTYRYVSDEINWDITLQTPVEASISTLDNVPVIIAESDSILMQVRCPKHKGLAVSYKLMQHGRPLEQDSVPASGRLQLYLEGSCQLEAEASVRKSDGTIIKSVRSYHIVKLGDGLSDIENVFKPCSDDGFLIGVGNGDRWISLEIFDLNGGHLHHSVEHIADGEVRRFKIKDCHIEGPVIVKALYFYDYGIYQWSHIFEQSAKDHSLNLRLENLTDRTLPNQTQSLIIRTDPEVEVAASVFDASSETIRRNDWERSIYSHGFIFNPIYSIAVGRNGEKERYPLLMYANSSMARNFDAKETAIPDNLEDNAAVRQNFATTLLFEPSLVSDKDGVIKLDFKTGDKLSAFKLQLFAHNREMAHSTLDKEFTVDLPVRISLNPPRFIYSGDSLSLHVGLSSSADELTEGWLYTEYSDPGNGDSIKKDSLRVSLEAGSSKTEEFALAIPYICNGLQVLVLFVSDPGRHGSDAMLVRIPVLKPVQTINEAHSAVLPAGQDSDIVLNKLLHSFVNGPSEGARIKSIIIADMVKEALADSVECNSGNIIELGEALFVDILAGRGDKRGLSERIAECQNSDGGYAWFPGMRSSAQITSNILQKYISLKDRKLESGFLTKEQVEASVKYLDISYFSHRSNLNLSQYLSIRSALPEYGFDASSIGAKAMKDFRRQARKTLASNYSTDVLAKARNATTALNLGGEGKSLARDWGLNMRFEKIASTLVESISQYAVEHENGGLYYPNAILGNKGLIENEAAAHACIVKLLGRYPERRTLADGICLWLMLQKETQDWEASGGFAEALACILESSENILQTKVLSVNKTFELPFDNITETGNGMGVRCSYVRSDGKILQDGDKLEIGEIIKAIYHISSVDNRSYVLMQGGFPACLRPVNQLSGLDWRYNAYRNMLKDKTEYWFEVLSETGLTLEQEFFVEQSGTFQCPAIEIHSLYAEHYSANSSGGKTLDVK